MNQTQQDIRAIAARLVVQEGLEYGLAKKRALKELGLGRGVALPDNDQLEEAVREYIEIFCAETQPVELHALRATACVWMERLQAFRPHLSGAVWRGTATALSDIYIQLFCDDPKSAEISLIDHNVRYVVSSVAGFKGEDVDALSVSVACPGLGAEHTRRHGDQVGLHLMIYDFDDLRGALKPDAKGRPWRGDLAAVKQLLEVKHD
jgi:hypothetical protein